MYVYRNLCQVHDTILCQTTIVLVREKLAGKYLVGVIIASKVGEYKSKTTT